MLRQLRQDSSRRGPSHERSVSSGFRENATIVGSMGTSPEIVDHSQPGELIGVVEDQEDEGLDRVVGNTHSTIRDSSTSKGSGPRVLSSHS